MSALQTTITIVIIMFAVVRLITTPRPEAVPAA
jgi:hypothetical protein